MLNKWQALDVLLVQCAVSIQVKSTIHACGQRKVIPATHANITARITQSVQRTTLCELQVSMHKDKRVKF